MIDGDRVRLRRLEREDIGILHGWMNDRDLMTWARFRPDHMKSRSALDKEFEKELAGEDADRTTYIVEDRASGKAIGWSVVRTWDRKHVSANVGIALGNRALWGKGLGTEAMRLLLELVFDHEGWHRADLWTLAENERAIRSFEKCGFQRVGVERESTYFDGRYHDILHMEMLKAEWDGRKGR